MQNKFLLTTVTDMKWRWQSRILSYSYAIKKKTVWLCMYKCVSMCVCVGVWGVITYVWNFFSHCFSTCAQLDNILLFFFYSSFIILSRPYTCYITSSLFTTVIIIYTDSFLSVLFFSNIIFLFFFLFTSLSLLPHLLLHTIPQHPHYPTSLRIPRNHIHSIPPRAHILTYAYLYK